MPDNPFDSSDNPFESSARAPETSAAGSAAAPFPDETTPATKPRASAGLRPTRKPGTSPFGTSSPPAESDVPFGTVPASAPVSPKAEPNGDPFLDPPAPPTPRKTSRSKAPTPEEEEFEENPFAPSAYRRKPRATTHPPEAVTEEPAVETPAGEEESSPFETTENPPRPRGVAPRSTESKYLPMPAPDESGWRPATQESPSQDDAEENPWR